jgi:hypothetical protein
MAKKMTPEEAKAWFEKNKERLKKQFEVEKDDDDLPPEKTPGGVVVGPENELAYRRILREIEESGSDEDE